MSDDLETVVSCLNANSLHHHLTAVIEEEIGWRGANERKNIIAEYKDYRMKETKIDDNTIEMRPIGD